MKEKIKALFTKYREIIMYLIFGVLTTAVGWIVYFSVFWTWKAIFSIPAEDTTSAIYILGYTVSQIIQWVCAVLFAFFTNEKWVFTDAQKNVHRVRRIIAFSGGRVITLGIDYVVTFLGAMILSGIWPSLTSCRVLSLTLNLADLISKFCAAVIVIVCNYIFSKLFVFKKGKS